MRGLNSEEAKKRIIDVHGHRYDLSNLVYKNRRTKIELICPNHGSWTVLPEVIWKGAGCPDCSFKSFGDNFKNLLYEWDYTKNKLSPYEISYGSNKKVWWICPNNHSYDMAPKQKTQLVRPQGCPFCANMRVDKTNSIAALKPDWINEWNFDRNGARTPHNVGIQSNKKNWWKCAEGHEWSVSPNSRVTYSTGCPNCAKSGYKPELDGYLYLHKIQVNNKVGFKYGITNYPSQRAEQLLKRNNRLTKKGFSVRIKNLFIFKGSGVIVQKLENELSEIYGNNFFSIDELPEGYTETIKYEFMKIYKIYSFLLNSELNLYSENLRLKKFLLFIIELNSSFSNE